MKDIDTNVNQRIAARLRELRSGANLSLEALAQKTSVSRSMISLIERSETSPTAVVLEKLSSGLGVSLASLFDAPKATDTPSSPIARRAEQAEWRDPASGYIRRHVSPLGIPQPMRLVEVVFPPKKRVAFETHGQGPGVHQQIWVIQGEIEITVGNVRHRLGEGDCLAMRLDGPTVFRNPTTSPTRYVVVVETEKERGKR